MHAYIKPINSKDDVFIKFPLTSMALPLTDKVGWLVANKIDFGYVDGKIAGVYLSNTDAMVFKLKFGA